ncbi:MAG TPA: DMT family transporter [Methanocorpusculum sp.]|nr:DMT family transporter [Methanocorpusculum sp.]
MKAIGVSTLLFPFLVFLGGCCFGPSSPVIKLAYEAGFSQETMIFTQYAFGLAFMIILSGIFFGVSIIRKKSLRPSHHSVRDIILLIVCGISIAMVSTTYLFALQTISASLSVILLFQYTWISILAEAVIKRKMPDTITIISVVILIGATLLAVGLGSIDLSSLDPMGVVFGMLSAVFYAIYIQLIGRLNKGLKPVFRSLILLSIAVVFLSIIFTPFFFTPQFISETLIGEGLWVYGLVLGSLGCAMPNFLFAIASPKVPPQLTTILSSSELPASIICAVIIISEAVTFLQWVGVILLFFGIALPTLAGYFKEKRLSHSQS